MVLTIVLTNNQTRTAAKHYTMILSMIPDSQLPCILFHVYELNEQFLKPKSHIYAHIHYTYTLYMYILKCIGMYLGMYTYVILDMYI